MRKERSKKHVVFYEFEFAFSVQQEYLHLLINEYQWPIQIWHCSIEIIHSKLEQGTDSCVSPKYSEKEQD